jgi:hypothetical protein
MSTEPIGFTFDETMSGGFALGESDPQTGKDRGQLDGSELAMHATVTIDDLDAFIADPGHLGGLTGSVDFTPLGSGIEAPGGVFNLFSPTADPTLKLMVYELAFQHQGKSYYLAGHKKVRDASPLDLWKATTTLYTQLHEGADKEAPVVGAGVLSLGVTQLMALVSTMRVTNADNHKQEVETMMKFGRFFMGDLWNTYVKHAGR